LLVDREKERNKFIKNTFYTIEADLKERNHDATFKAKLVSYNNQTIAKGDDFSKFDSGLKNDKLLLINAAKAKEIKMESEKGEWHISKIESKPTSSSAAPPFTTSTLQQDASRRFGYSPKRTMVVAQKLYEQGFITYMRTDSTNLSKEALAASKKFILDKFGKDFLSESSNIYKSNFVFECICNLTFINI
jgi:DNA topoisomerase-1